jgi:hypothetical protein
MTRKFLLMTGSVLLLLALVLAAGVVDVSGQETSGPPIITTANNVVGVGSYVAAQAMRFQRVTTQQLTRLRR